MTDTEFDILINAQDFLEKEFFEEAFKFWFKDTEQIRTPFPEEIQSELRKKALSEFLDWVSELSGEEKVKLTKDEIAEIFEMILFNQAIEMVEDEDQKITICYPFLPRTGDVVQDKNRGASIVLERRLEVGEDEKKYLKVVLRNDEREQTWETEFKLPA